eukprot:349632-Chlamydomonas_euryale.AAC.55
MVCAGGEGHACITGKAGTPKQMAAHHERRLWQSNQAPAQLHVTTARQGSRQRERVNFFLEEQQYGRLA